MLKLNHKLNHDTKKRRRFNSIIERIKTPFFGKEGILCMKNYLSQ